MAGHTACGRPPLSVTPPEVASCYRIEHSVGTFRGALLPSIVHITTSFHCKSGMPKDDITNGFTFTGPGDVAATAAAAKAAVKGFWQDGGHLADLLAASVSRSKKFTVKTYVLSSTSGAAPDVRVPPGYGHPIDSTDEFFHTAGDITSLSFPSQVAMCLSYHTDYGASVEHEGSGPRPAERKRGRLFLGPFVDSGSTNFTDTSTGASNPASTLIHDVGVAGQILLTTGPAAIFGIWSRKDNLVRPVVQMWIDGRWDTQRRRLEAADFRQTFDGSTVLP